MKIDEVSSRRMVAAIIISTVTFMFSCYAGNNVFFVALNNATPSAPYTSWATAATNIQDAIDVALNGDTVIVSNGVYQTGGRVVAGAMTNRVVIDKAITVQSVNGPAFTTIRGNLPNGDTAVRGVWIANGATLIGFTITNGGTRTSGDQISEQSAGGVIGSSTAATVSRCIIQGNSANYGAGGGGQCTFRNCLITGNSAFQGGGGVANAVLFNCTVVGNAATFPGGVGGGVLDSAVENSIVYNNTAPFFGPNYAQFFGILSLDYSCSTPLPEGSGNFANDPMFVAANDYHLDAGSPCRDTGNANAPGVHDLDGSVRIVNGYVDVGAYEYQGAGQGDYDGDGLGNGDEGVAGTGFADSNDVFEVSGVNVMSPASIMFDSEVGRVYAVDRNEALLPEPQVWTEFTNNIEGTGSAIIINDQDDATNRNYRVRVMLVP